MRVQRQCFSHTHSRYIVYQASQTVPPPPEKCLADVISMHEMLTNQILLFHSGDSSNTLASVCKTPTGAVLDLQILITSARPFLSHYSGG